MGRVESLRTEYKFKNTEIGKIPVDWKVAKLGEVTQIIMGQSPPSDSYFEFVNGVPFFQGNAEFGAKFPKILKWCNSPRKLAETGDILVSVRAPVGDVNIAPIECCIGRGLAALRGTRIHNDYLYFVMNYFKDTLVKIGQGSTFEAINKRDIFELKIPFPTILEQNKIAEILISVDEAINRKQEIIEKTNILKKGLMQELLTRGIGHKKFKKTEIGEIPMDWEVVKLEDCAAQQKYSFVDGPFGSNLKSIHYVDEGIPVIQSQFIISGKFRDVATFYITAQKARELERSRVLPGDIVIAKIGMNYGASATVPENYPEAVLSGNTMKITPNDNRVVTRFLQYLLHYLRMSKAFDQIVSTTAQPAITLKGVKNLKIPLPVIKEQKKIAEILTSVDEEIEKEIAQKERIENVKKGLMQVLLTGKIRVKI